MGVPRDWAGNRIQGWGFLWGSSSRETEGTAQDQAPKGQEGDFHSISGRISFAK